jgi:hypothetical protein
MDERQKCLAVLRIEIGDLAEDIGALQERTRLRAAQGEITEYVLRENEAVLERERRGVSVVAASLEGVRAEDHADLDALVDALRERFKRCLTEGDYDPVVGRLLERKLAKVAGYVRHGLRPA